MHTSVSTASWFIALLYLPLLYVLYLYEARLPDTRPAKEKTFQNRG